MNLLASPRSQGAAPHYATPQLESFHVITRIGRMLTRAGTLLSHPTAFLIVVCYVGIWLVFNPKTFDWQAAATVATWVMTLFIQRAEHRDTQAIHAKLDELLRVEGRARSDLIHLDAQEPEAIEQHRAQERRPKG
jgi:low affinity Fe/Cu permease